MRGQADGPVTAIRLEVTERGQARWVIGEQLVYRLMRALRDEGLISESIGRAEYEQCLGVCRRVLSAVLNGAER